MKPATAARLAAALDGRLARWRLDRAARAGDQYAIDAVWAAWLEAPTDAAWALLTAWNRPAADANADLSRFALGADLEPAIVEAADRDHPIGLQARERIADGGPRLVDAACAHAALTPDGLLAAFCVAEGVAPSDPVDRALFYVLTGQSDRYRATDPDGQLLARGYAAADAEARRRLRVNLVEVAGTDLLGVVVAGERSTEEVGYLARRLTEHEDWTGLWRLATEASLAEALDVVSSIPTGSEPEPDADRALFAMLRARPGVLAAALVPEAVRTGRVKLTGTARDVGFGDDRGRAPTVAVVNEVGGGTQAWVSVHDLAGRRLWSRRASGVMPGSTRVLPLADNAVLAAHLRDAAPRGTHVLELITRDENRTIADGAADSPNFPTYNLVHPYPPMPAGDGGFVWCADGQVLRGDGSGRVTRRFRPVPISGRMANLNGHWGAEFVAVDLATRGQAVGRGSWLTLYDERPTGPVVVGEVLASVGSAFPLRGIVVDGPDRVVTIDTAPLFTLTAWQRQADGRLERAVRTQHATASPVLWAPRRLAGIPAARRLVVDGRHWFDLDTLAPAAAPRGVARPLGAHLAVSPTGDHLAVARGGTVTLYQVEPPSWLVELVDRPISSTGPADLRRVVAFQGRALLPRTRRLLTMLRARLEYRFGADVELGGDDGPGGDDFVIGDGP